MQICQTSLVVFKKAKLILPRPVFFEPDRDKIVDHPCYERTYFNSYFSSQYLLRIKIAENEDLQTVLYKSEENNKL